MVGGVAHNVTTGQRGGVVPGHPLLRVGFDRSLVPLHGNEVVEGFGPAQLSCVNEADEEVSDVGAILATDGLRRPETDTRRGRCGPGRQGDRQCARVSAAV